MRKILFSFESFALMLLLSVAPAAQAQDFKPYAGVGLGAFILDTGLAGVGKQNVFGGYGQFGVDFGDFIGAELRLGTTANTSFTYAGVNISYGLDYFFSYLGKFQVPVNDQLRIFILAGGSTGKASATGSLLWYTATASSTTNSGSFGAGFDYSPNPQWRFGAEYMRYFSDVDGIVANVKFMF